MVNTKQTLSIFLLLSILIFSAHAQERPVEINGNIPQNSSDATVTIKASKNRGGVPYNVVAKIFDIYKTTLSRETNLLEVSLATIGNVVSQNLYLIGEGLPVEVIKVDQFGLFQLPPLSGELGDQAKIQAENQNGFGFTIKYLAKLTDTQQLSYASFLELLRQVNLAGKNFPWYLRAITFGGISREFDGIKFCFNSPQSSLHLNEKSYILDGGSCVEVRDISSLENKDSIFYFDGQVVFS